MSLEQWTQFFQWATIVAMAIYLWTAVMVIFAKKFIYGFHKKWFDMSYEAYSIAIYAYLGLFKVMMIVFIVVPYLALLLMH